MDLTFRFNSIKVDVADDVRIMEEKKSNGENGTRRPANLMTRDGDLEEG